MANEKIGESFMDIVTSVEATLDKEEKPVVEKKAEEKAAEPAKASAKKEKKGPLKNKGSLSVDTRGEVKTLYFPAEAVKNAVSEGIQGFNLEGYEHAGEPVKIFVPRNKDGVEARRISEKNEKLPKGLVMTAPKDATFQTYRTVEDKKAPNGEKMVEGAVVSIVVVEKLQNEYAKKRAANEKETKEPEVKAVPDKEAGKEAEGKPAEEKAEQPKENITRFWINPNNPPGLKERLEVLRDNKGYLIHGFEMDKNTTLSIFVPKGDKDLDVKRMKNWIKVDLKKNGDQKYMFHLYKKDVNGRYVDSGYKIGAPLMHKKVTERNQNIEKLLNQNKEKDTLSR